MIVKQHTRCKRNNCSIIDKEATPEQTIKAVKDNEGNVLEPEWYWARVGGILHRFEQGDLE